MNRRKAIYIPDELWDRVREVAASQDMSASQLIRLALKKLLAEIPKSE